MAGPGLRFRTDIQALRGFAVLVVLFFHAGISQLPGGFLGVDVFFVISGYLITRLIKDGIERGDFSFADFYFRRAKRLLPAAYVTFLVTTLLAPFFLTSEVMQDFKWQLIGSLTFYANIVLRHQSDYFATAADLKPLLHIWSLSLEEQYYLVLPAALVFTPRRWWRAASLVAVAASLAFCLVMVTRKPDLAFYWLASRAWELGIGSIGALFVLGPRAQLAFRGLFWPAVAVLLVLPVARISHFHPGPDALLICAATLIVILRRHERAFENPIGRVLAGAGDISYSLYLVHWPLFAFLNNAWIDSDRGAPPLSLRLTVLAAALVLGYLLYRFVEVPTRRAKTGRSPQAVFKILAGTASLVVVFSVVARAPARDYAYLLRSNSGFSDACESTSNFNAPPECRNSDAPEILVWGDSFAMHLVPGLAADARVAQATRSLCGPVLGLAVVTDERPRTWAQDCIAFNDSVIDYLKRTDSVKIVVLSSPFNYLVNAGGTLLQRDGAALREVPTGAQATLSGLQRTADAVHAAGKRIVLMEPPPRTRPNTGRCNERREMGLLSLGNTNCNITVADWKHRTAEVDQMLQLAPLPIVSPADVLCDQTVCRTVLNGTIVFRDEHFTHDGARLMAREAHWHERIERQAR